MRLEPHEPKNESDLFQGLRQRTGLYYYYERVEPANESGFPDVYYVARNGSGEGTIELKCDRGKSMNLNKLLRGSQKSALLSYHEGGGRKRYVLSCWQGQLFLWDTEALRSEILRKGSKTFTSTRPWSIAREKPEDLARWLSSNGLKGME